MPIPDKLSSLASQTNSKTAKRFGAMPLGQLLRSRPRSHKKRPASQDFADISKLLIGSGDSRAFALNAILVLLVICTLYFGRTAILPMVLGIFLSFLLRPIVRQLAVWKIPESVGAGIVLLVMLGTLSFGVSQLAEPASLWMRKAPESLQEIEWKLRNVLRPAKQVSQAAEQVEQMTGGAKDKEVQTVEIKSPGLLDMVLLGMKNILGGVVITFGALYFLLASGDFFLRTWVEVLPGLTEKKRAVTIVRELTRTMSRYLGTITVTNIVLGVLTAFAMSLLGMPHPILWGVLGGVLNYIPYLGALVAVIIIGLVALLHFSSVGHALLAPLSYWALTIVESGLISPIFLGRQLALNPVMIFCSLVFWGWLWGIPGTFLAVPNLMALKIICDHSKPLAFIGKFLGR
jgi:predicted PurR-regulated permease PerM